MPQSTRTIGSLDQAGRDSGRPLVRLLGVTQAIRVIAHGYVGSSDAHEESYVVRTKPPPRRRRGCSHRSRQPRSLGTRHATPRPHPTPRARPRRPAQPRPRQPSSSTGRHHQAPNGGYYYDAGQQNTHLTITQVGRKVKFHDSTTNVLRGKPKACDRQHSRSGLVVVCRVPRASARGTRLRAQGLHPARGRLRRHVRVVGALLALHALRPRRRADRRRRGR